MHPSGPGDSGRRAVLYGMVDGWLRLIISPFASPEVNQCSLFPFVFLTYNSGGAQRVATRVVLLGDALIKVEGLADCFAQYRGTDSGRMRFVGRKLLGVARIWAE